MAPARLDPQGYYRRIPLAPDRMHDRVTGTQDAIVLCHLGVPRLDLEDWQLTVDGLVERPLTLGFDDLARFPKAEVTSVHQCAGSPLQPFEPTRRVCNVVWGGALLADILAICRPRPAAKYVWSSGADHGEFGGVAVDAYNKDLPLSRVPADVLIAYELNGAPLPAENGFPARLVVPGFYGTNSVKWLTRMTLEEGRAPGPFTTRWYNDPVVDADGRDTGATLPVWGIAPESVVVAPAPEAELPAQGDAEIWGWAWADGGVSSVDVTTDGGATWSAAALERPRGRAWQRFRLAWRPTTPGTVAIASRATAIGGTAQPASGRRNALHWVAVRVA